MDTLKKRIVFESWFLVDFALFNDEPKKDLTEDVYKEYISAKGAFLSNLFELYHLLDIQLPDQCYNTQEEMFDYMEDRVSASKEVTTEALKTEELTIALREELQEMGYSADAKDSGMPAYVVSRTMKRMLLDELLLRGLIEGADKEILEGWNFNLLYKSYKSFRDSLVESCFSKSDE